MESGLTSSVKTPSLVDTLVERLEAAIISGELPSGSRINEQSLAQKLGVSRSPLREAFRRLEGRKLVKREPNLGPRVATLSLEDLHDILIMREALEGMAARCAAELMSDAETAELLALVEQHRKQDGLRDGNGYYQEGPDFDFHFRIIRASRNERLISTLCGDLYDLLRVYRYKAKTTTGRAERALDEHQAIAQALADRNPARAEAAMRRHLRNARMRTEKRLQEAWRSAEMLDLAQLRKPTA